MAWCFSVIQWRSKSRLTLLVLTLALCAPAQAFMLEIHDQWASLVVRIDGQHRFRLSSQIELNQQTIVIVMDRTPGTCESLSMGLSISPATYRPDSSTAAHALINVDQAPSHRLQGQYQEGHENNALVAQFDDVDKSLNKDMRSGQELRLSLLELADRNYRFPLQGVADALDRSMALCASYDDHMRAMQREQAI